MAYRYIAAKRVLARLLFACVLALALAPVMVPSARASGLQYSSITRIQAGAFQGDTSLKQMRLPSTLRYIDDYAFAGCTALKNIYIYSLMTDIADTAFEGVSGLTIWCLTGSDASVFARDHGIAYEYLDAMRLTCDKQGVVSALTPITWSVSEILPGIVGVKRVDIVLYRNGAIADSMTATGDCTFTYAPSQPGSYYINVTVSAGSETASSSSPVIECVEVIKVSCDTVLNGAVGLPITWRVDNVAPGQGYIYNYSLFRNGARVTSSSGSSASTYTYTPNQAGEYRLEATLVRQGTQATYVSDAVPVAAAVYLGRYEQDNNPASPEPLEWRVLTVRNGKALVLTEYVIRNESFFNPAWIKFKYCFWEGSYIGSISSNIWYKTDEKMYVTPTRIPLEDGVTFVNDAYLSERYHARHWLNGTFYNSAFTSAERARIVLTTNTTADYVSGDTVVDGGPDTRDYVFFLSVEEQAQYLPTKESRYARPTAVARSQGVGMGSGSESSYCRWWLRSPGKYRVNAMCNMFYSSGLVLVDNDVGHKGGYRPAMWITIGG